MKANVFKKENVFLNVDIKTKQGVLKFNEDVVWNEGEEKVKLAINLLMPGQSEGNTHLKLLSALSRKLIHEDFKSALLNSDDVDEVTNLIDEALGL